MADKRPMKNKQVENVNAILAKISKPKLSKCFQWERLLNLIDSFQNKPLVWISGQAGCGKRLLVANYLKSRRLDHIWYQVDSRDVDPATLFHYLKLSIGSQIENQCKSLPALNPEHFKDPSVFCKNYFEAFFSLCGPTPILVFNNCQKLQDDAQFFQIVQYMASQIPPGGQIFLISRTVPPSNFARMVLYQEMGLLQGEDFKLTPNEIQILSSEIESVELDLAQAKVIYEKTGGWMAAVVLLLAAPDLMVKFLEPSTPIVPEILFEYFSGEVFEQLDEVTQNFLLRTAWLPKFSIDMAQEFTGYEQAGSILHRLARENFFTIQHNEGQQNLYEYHPLFKEYLKNRARATLSRGMLLDLKCRAATLLIQQQRYGEAAHLFILTEQWDQLGDLICDRAPRLIEQGRYQTLYRDISSLPGEMVEKKPWMLYWLGVGRLLFAPGESKCHFEKAFALFKSQDDIDGCFYALSGILNAINYQQTDFREMDRWFDEVKKIRDSCPEERSVEVEAQLAISLLTNFYSRAIQNPQFDSWIKHAESFWYQVPNPTMRLELAGILLDYHSRMGNSTQSKQLLNKIGLLLQATDPGSNASIVAHMRIALFHWFHGDNAMARKYCKKVTKNTRNMGNHVWECMIWVVEAAASLAMDEFEEADGYIEKIGLRIASQEPNLYTTFYYCLLGWRALRCGEIEFAVKMFTKATKIADDIGAVTPDIYSYHGLANALFAQGDFNGARQNLVKALDNVGVQKMSALQYQLLLSNAYFEFKTGDRDEGLGSLKKALSLGRKHGYSQRIWLGQEIMGFLCGEALSNNIEVPWVKQLIQNANLKPKKILCEKENWPKPLRIRIYTLGQFHLEKDGSPVVFATKAPRKQLDMLKTIISLDGKEISREAVIDELWPDAEGDKAAKSFGVTLYRLRRLLGNENSVQLQNGKLSLDSNYCWVDCREFEHLVSQAENATVSDDISKAIDILEKAMEMYKGSFLSQEELTPNMVSQRDRLRNTFLRALENLCQNLEMIGDLERAAKWYRHAFDLGDLFENFYQRYMECLKKLGRKSEAVSVYEKCKKCLAANFGTVPSNETEAIYRSILNNS